MKIKRVLFIVAICSASAGCVGEHDRRISCDNGFTTNWHKRVYIDESGLISWKTENGWNIYKPNPGEQCYIEKK